MLVSTLLHDTDGRLTTEQGPSYYGVVLIAGRKMRYAKLLVCGR